MRNTIENGFSANNSNRQTASAHETSRVETGKINLVFDPGNPFVKMAVEIFHQFLIDEAAGFINAVSTLHINARLLQRTFAEERESMVVRNKEKIPRFGTPAYEMFDISFNTAQNIHIVNQETK